MKPDWDKLMDDFKDSKTALVGDVDCTAEGKPLCETNKVTGYPTIKHGDPSDLKDYDGGRSYDDFKKFADENLGPSCGPENLDLCKDEDKAHIEKFMKMDVDELSTAIEDADSKIAKVEEKGQKKVSKLQSKVADLQKDVAAATKSKDDAVAKEKKTIGLGMMKAVTAAKKKQDEGGAGKKKKKKKEL